MQNYQEESITKLYAQITTAIRAARLKSMWTQTEHSVCETFEKIHLPVRHRIIPLSPFPPRRRQMAFCWYFIRNVFFSRSFQRFLRRVPVEKLRETWTIQFYTTLTSGFYRCRFKNNNTKNLTIFTHYLCTQILQQARGF